MQANCPELLDFLERCSPDQRHRLTEQISRMESGQASEDDLLAVEMAMELAREANPQDEGPQPEVVRYSEEVPDSDRLASLHADRLAGVRHSIHVYGRAAALCIEPTDYGLESSAREPLVHTLTFEVAPSKATEQRFDWNKKIQFRLTRRELPLVAAVFLGFINDLTLAGHGPHKDKRLVLRNQPGKVYLRMSQGTAAHSVPVTHEDVFMVCVRLMEAVGKNASGLDSFMVMQLIKRTAVVYNESKSHEAQCS